MESYLGEETQLAKVHIDLSRSNDNQYVSRTAFNSVTPPPSPHIDVEYDGDDERPPHSYVCLVILALLECPDRQATIREIYSLITLRFPYYRDNRLHWKNSVRHNLTVFSCFQRVANEEVDKKGGSRGSFLWRLVGDWKSVLEKEEALTARRSRGDVQGDTRIKRPNSVTRVAYDRSKWGKGKISRPSKHDKKDRENSKKRKRDKERKMKLKSRHRHVDRIPLAEFNLCGPMPKLEPLPTRMPTPPPKLPGIDNLFLTSPAPSVPPPDKAATELWVGAQDLDMDSVSHLSFNLDDIANFNTDLKTIQDYPDFVSPVNAEHVTPLQLAESGYTSLTDIGLDLHKHQQLYPPHQPYDEQSQPNHFYQYTPEPSPARTSPSLSSGSCPSGYTPPSTTTNIWELVEPEADGFMGLLTLDTDWWTSTKHDGGFIKL